MYVCACVSVCACVYVYGRAVGVVVAFWQKFKKKTQDFCFRFFHQRHCTASCPDLTRNSPLDTRRWERSRRKVQVCMSCFLRLVLILVSKSFQVKRGRKKRQKTRQTSRSSTSKFGPSSVRSSRKKRSEEKNFFSCFEFWFLVKP